MTILSSPSRRLSTHRPPARYFDIADVVVCSEFPFRDLPEAREREARGDRATISVARTARLSPHGDLVRELGDEAHCWRTWESGDGYYWSVVGVGDFLVDLSGTRVQFAPHPSAHQGDVEQVLLGPILGAALQLMGIPLLHAGAIVVDGAAVAVTAPSGWGKSTLVAHMARLGYPILSDDTLPVRVAVDGGVTVQSYVPRMKLYDDSLESLGDDPARHETQLTWIEKRRVPLDRATVAPPSERYPLGAVYQMRPARPGTPLSFSASSPAAATLALAASMYMPDLFTGARGASRFRAAAAIARAGLYREVRYERSFENLPDVARAIIEDARSR
ncbi:MAG: hypothetical protein IT304_01165 [Dehalococcoidia bacterium]|nr:hypothetical protein [Dehalococcoidia bacterium]